MYDTLGAIRAEVLSRPKFSILFENDDANKIALLIKRAVNQAQISYYETNRRAKPNYEKIDTITLPAGVAFGVNSKKYVLNSGTTPVLTADLLALKKLSILGDSSAKTDSKSTYDTDTAEGSGIPDDATVIGVSDVYHELIGEGADQQLILVIGTTAAGSAPKVVYTYIPELVLADDDADSVDVPFGDFLTTFMQKVNANLKLYVGFDGF